MRRFAWRYLFVTSLLALHGAHLSASIDDDPEFESTASKLREVLDPQVKVTEGEGLLEFKRLQNYMELAERADNPLRTVGTVGVFGGYNSCRGPKLFGLELYREVLRLLVDRAYHGEYYRVVASCFGRFTSDATYMTSSKPRKAQSGDWTVIPRELTLEARHTDFQNVYIFGHSYGGWLSLKTTLALPEYVKVTGLASIDPISKKYCKQSVFVAAYLSSIFTLNPSPECTRSPRDVSMEDAYRIHTRTDWWYNFFQDNSIFLHSSTMPYAQNKFIDYDYSGIIEMTRAHATIDEDARVWSLLRPLLN